MTGPERGGNLPDRPLTDMVVYAGTAKSTCLHWPKESLNARGGHESLCGTVFMLDETAPVLATLAATDLRCRAHRTCGARWAAFDRARADALDADPR